ncbi:hypothetical protein BD324DRAFT_623774 [Kockovaella imperatae]|uniref:EamA domain-containing protein n=1 Tax=Kockovaella imperatae TaxID=4999 RepID=A0A1Y1UIQ0_9TREE|nr:hypothetical protein BD324DRAFT_623774 [Kockovaella imperatae]ORX37911.1 hypothetical protein BD324DRAFT_623774 [Kockovaella imperatae]
MNQPFKSRLDDQTTGEYHDEPLPREISRSAIIVDTSMSALTGPSSDRVSHRRSTSNGSLDSIISVKSVSGRNLLRRLIIPLVILLSISLASASQTEAAHYLLVELNYNQSYFAFFLTHVSFIAVFPLHILILWIFRPSIRPAVYLEGLRNVIGDQMDLTHSGHEATWREIAPGWVKKSIGMTVLISLPALSWFIAVVFTTAMDVTTIYATSTFYAYFFSMLLLKQPLSRITIGSICMAFAGVLVIVFAGSSKSNGTSVDNGPKNRVLGDIIMTGGAIFLGLYEVVYKLALPEEPPETASRPPTAAYSELPVHATQAAEFDQSPPVSRAGTPPPSRPRPQGRSQTVRSDDIPLRVSPTAARFPAGTDAAPKTSRPSSPASSDSSSRNLPSKLIEADSLQLPPALLANFLTSSIGLTTIFFLWMPLPILHWLGWETFHWPGSRGESAMEIWTDLNIVSWGGAIYNAGLMILIGIWGPTTSSVANLLTIGLVAVFDAVWGGSIPDFQTLVGVAMICLGFGVLLWEGEG